MSCKLLKIENNKVIHQGPMRIKKNGGNVIMLCCKCDETSSGITYCNHFLLQFFVSEFVTYIFINYRYLLTVLWIVSSLMAQEL